MTTHTAPKDKFAQAQDIINSCVHCGFCLATCPTYKLTGNELDSPRGRIYQINTLLETGEAKSETITHLDRCLTCQSCETTCPSGVKYTSLLDYAKNYIEQNNLRATSQSWKIKFLVWFFSNPFLTGTSFFLYRLIAPLLPLALKRSLPAKRRFPVPSSGRGHAKKVVIVQGCVQNSMLPAINQAAENILVRLGYRVERLHSCCGALALHASQEQQAEATMLGVLDKIAAMSEQPEAIIMSASACSLQLKKYPQLLEGITSNEQLEKMTDKVFDISEFLLQIHRQRPLALAHKEKLKTLDYNFHSPCTLTHGLKATDSLAQFLQELGLDLQFSAEPHICCGSAGLYSILQQDFSKKLLANKLASFANPQKQLITANIGCLSHLNQKTSKDVLHFIEVLEKAGIGYKDNHQETKKIA